MGDRGQAFTLEAFVAGLLVLGSVAFALQATAVTPLSASTSNQQVGNQERATVFSTMGAAKSNGTLRAATLDWNNSSSEWSNVTAEDGEFHNAGPPNEFGAALNETFGAQRTAFNVRLRYATPGGGTSQTVMIDQGTPSDDAVSASRSVVLYDDDTMPNGSAVSSNNSTFYAPDAEPNGTLYNVVDVRITVWRI